MYQRDLEEQRQLMCRRAGRLFPIGTDVVGLMGQLCASFGRHGGLHHHCHQPHHIGGGSAKADQVLVSRLINIAKKAGLLSYFLG